MVDHQSYVKRQLSIRTELCLLGERLATCHPEDRQLYEQIALQYAAHLRKIELLFAKPDECTCLILNDYSSQANRDDIVKY